ncbi:TIGR04086 family membrane protein [Arthrobacter sp. H20]|uniref:TIGR04086 family membrane protein n=1 Tax=Arthrobacter sp. H20 TaxID=1267981 RepID=UPI0004AEC4C3
MSTPGTGNDPSERNTPPEDAPKHADGTPDWRDSPTTTDDDGAATQVHQHVPTRRTPERGDADTEVHTFNDSPTDGHGTPDNSGTTEREPTRREQRAQPDANANTGAVAGGSGAGAAETSPSTRTQPVTAQPVSHTANPDDARYRNTHDDRPALPASAERAALLQYEKDTFGGMKFGSAFFGWLTATGMAVLLTALVAAGGAVFGLSTNTDLNDAADRAAADPQTVGITGAIVLLVILLVSYFAGGYVAGRMARFNGAKQGVAVWLWALIFAVLVAVLGLIFGRQFDILANLNSFPRLPLNEGNLTTAGIIAVLIAVVAALGGAVLGGLTGMRYHRKIDRADYEYTTTR